MYCVTDCLPFGSSIIKINIYIDSKSFGHDIFTLGKFQMKLEILLRDVPQDSNMSQISTPFTPVLEVPGCRSSNTLDPKLR